MLPVAVHGPNVAGAGGVGAGVPLGLTAGGLARIGLLEGRSAGWLDAVGWVDARRLTRWRCIGLPRRSRAGQNRPPTTAAIPSNATPETLAPIPAARWCWRTKPTTRTLTDANRSAPEQPTLGPAPDAHFGQPRGLHTVSVTARRVQLLASALAVAARTPATNGISSPSPSVPDSPSSSGSIVGLYTCTSAQDSNAPLQVLE